MIEAANTVSVVTPAFNSENHIARCLDSVRKQTHHPIEHIVVDGGSTDATVAIAATSGAKIICGPDAGVYHAMNKGISAAKGDIIHILNSDDEYVDEDVVNDIVTHMHHDALDMCHACVVQTDSERKSVWRIGRDISRAQLLRRMQVAHPSVFVRRTVYERYGSFCVSFAIAGDQDWLLRVWDEVKVGYVERTVVNMAMGGLALSQPERSYRESMVAAVLHGRHPVPALGRMYVELVRHRLALISRKLGYRRR